MKLPMAESGSYGEPSASIRWRDAGASGIGKMTLEKEIRDGPRVGAARGRRVSWGRFRRLGKRSVRAAIGETH